jgi:hypothetical protein
MLIDKDNGKRSILERDNDGWLWLPIHYACQCGGDSVVALDTDTEKKSIHEKDEDGRLPMDVACSEDPGSTEMIQLLRCCKPVYIRGL